MKTRPVSEIAVAPPTASEIDIAALLRPWSRSSEAARTTAEMRGNISPIPAPASTQAAPMRIGVTLQRGRHQLARDAGEQERGPDPERGVVVEPGTEAGLHLRGAGPAQRADGQGRPDSHGGTS